MSKLTNAPLVEVIFEIKWDILNRTDVVDFQYLHGDLYSRIKEKYSFRESLVPPEVPFDVMKGIPVFRFRPQRNSHPLVQIGPGLLTYNALDSQYYWEEFREESNRLIGILDDIYPKYNDLNVSPMLTYIDFFEFNGKNVNSLDFINSSFHLNISQSFVDSSDATFTDMNAQLNYKVKNGSLSLNLSDGKINNEKNGVVLQTKVIGDKMQYSKSDLSLWIDSAHELSSKVFKSLTKGDLFESFK